MVRKIKIVDYWICPECEKHFSPDELDKNERISEIFNPQTTCPDCILTMTPHFKEIELNKNGDNVYEK